MSSLLGDLGIGTRLIYNNYSDEAILTYTYSLLLTDLSSDMHTSPETDGLEVVSKGTHDTAVPYCLCILSDGVARAEVGDDACSNGMSIELLLSKKLFRQQLR